MPLRRPFGVSYGAYKSASRFSISRNRGTRSDAQGWPAWLGWQPYPWWVPLSLVRRCMALGTALYSAPRTGFPHLLVSLPGFLASPLHLRYTFIGSLVHLNSATGNYSFPFPFFFSSLFSLFLSVLFTLSLLVIYFILASFFHISLTLLHFYITHLLHPSLTFTHFHILCILLSFLQVFSPHRGHSPSLSHPSLNFHILTPLVCAGGVLPGYAPSAPGHDISGWC